MQRKCTYIARNWRKLYLPCLAHLAVFRYVLLISPPPELCNHVRFSFPWQVLDMGCGVGFYIARLRDAGYEACTSDRVISAAGYYENCNDKGR